MNLKTLGIIILGLVVFLGIWLFNMVSGLALMVGFGFGILLHGYLKDIFNNFQKNIYLAEKSQMIHRKIELESELEKINKEV